MAFGKAVVAEAVDLLVDAFGELGRVAVGGHARDDLLVVLVQAALALPRGHGAAQFVGLACGEAGGDHGQLHHLFLEHGHAQGAFQSRLEFVLFIGHRLLALAPVQVGVDHAALDGAGPHDGDLDHQVVEAAGPQARQHAHLRATFDLEHTHGVGLADHAVGGVIAVGDVLQVERPAQALADEDQRLAQRGEHAQREHVDLEQAQRLEVVLVPLDHGAVFHGRVLHRHDAREPVLRDDEAAHVLREVARKTRQLADGLAREHADEVDELAHGQVIGPQAHGQQALGRWRSAIEPLLLFREAVDHLGVEAEGLAHVADGAAAPVGDDGGGQRGALAAVLAVDVLDHLLAALVLEVDVDVGRLVALLADEALEQQVGRAGSTAVTPRQ